MDSPFADTPAGYVDRISSFSRQEAYGRTYRPLAKFLSKVRTKSEVEEPTDSVATCLVWYYFVFPGVPTSVRPVVSPSMISALNEQGPSSAYGGRLVFLRGYPSPEWLAILGHIYQIKPEFWRRHLDFLALGHQAFPEGRPLPSSSSSIIQFRVASIGTWGRWWGLEHSIENLRRSAAIDMNRYLDALRAGRGWKQADSLVRQYILHDKEHFSIEQAVTVYLHVGERRDKWVVFVFLDCGNDLATSPEGPWLGGNSTIALPRMLVPSRDDSDMILAGSNESGQHVESSHMTTAKLSQNLSNIHLNYASFIKPHGSTIEPFYLLAELFKEDASSESQMLDLIANKIKTDTIGPDPNTDYRVIHSRLLHFQGFLEQRIEILQDKMDLLSRRGGGPWCQSKDDTDALTESSISSLVGDFEFLLKRAHHLLRKIERSVSLIMNVTSIDEAKRNTELSTTIFRFTVVASFFIPLSFTASFFGMNFHELGTGSLSIGFFFVMSFPILVVSILCLFIRQTRLRGLYRLLSGDSLKSKRRGKQDAGSLVSM